MDWTETTAKQDEKHFILGDYVGIISYVWRYINKKFVVRKDIKTLISVYELSRKGLSKRELTKAR